MTAKCAAGAKGELGRSSIGYWPEGLVVPGLSMFLDSGLAFNWCGREDKSQQSAGCLAPGISAPIDDFSYRLTLLTTTMEGLRQVLGTCRVRDVPSGYAK